MGRRPAKRIKRRKVYLSPYELAWTIEVIAGDHCYLSFDLKKHILKQLGKGQDEKKNCKEG